MSNRLLTFALPAPATLQADDASPDAAGERAATLRLLDAAGAPLAAAVSLPVPAPVMVETRGEDGGLRWAAHTPDLSLPVEIVPGTAAVELDIADGSHLFALADVAAADPRAPDEVRTFLDPNARWQLALVAERFPDAEAFFAHAASLAAFIAGQAPFSAGDVPFGVIALFWSSSADGGLFGATDDRLSNGRVLAGRADVVRGFVAAAGVSPRKTIVLVNSGFRAGAGGAGSDTPSWTTITAAPPERWEGIALHELGHAFGLADEYDSPYDLREPDPLEPNVSAESDPARTSWRTLRTVSSPPAPTAVQGQEGQHPAGTVGTFRGARYRATDRFRPSPTCRMRATTEPFCPVCQAHIRAELRG